MPSQIELCKAAVRNGSGRAGALWIRGLVARYPGCPRSRRILESDRAVQGDVFLTRNSSLFFRVILLLTWISLHSSRSSTFSRSLSLPPSLITSVPTVIAVFFLQSLLPPPKSSGHKQVTLHCWPWHLHSYFASQKERKKCAVSFCREVKMADATCCRLRCKSCTNIVKSCRQLRYNQRI